MIQELTAYKADVTIPVYGTIADADVYLKEKVDAVLAEKDAAIAELKANLQNHCTTCPVKEQEEAVLAEKDTEIRRLKRALWMHRAITAKLNKEGCKVMREYNPFIAIEEFNWQEIEQKCRDKAEEYK